MKFSEAVASYEEQCWKKYIPKETVMAFLVEIAQRERYDLYAHFDEEMPEDLYEEFSTGMERILQNEPMAHVLGYSWFYGYKMITNENVLIPRYETEELCAQILSRIDLYFPKEIPLECVDVGTGCGAIAITLKKEEPRLVMSASDISKEALEVAKENAKINEANITFVEGDMLEPIKALNKKFDILVCNPPYIPENEKMEPSVIDFEPHVALFGGKDGLYYYEKVFKGCLEVLKEKSMMAFEMGWNQKRAMEKLLKEYLPQADYEVVKDINGKNRMLFVYLGIDKNGV